MYDQAALGEVLRLLHLAKGGSCWSTLRREWVRKAQMDLSLAMSSWLPLRLVRHDGAEETVCLVVQACGEEEGGRVACQPSIPKG